MTSYVSGASVIKRSKGISKGAVLYVDEAVTVATCVLVGAVGAAIIGAGRAADALLWAARSTLLRMSVSGSDSESSRMCALFRGCAVAVFEASAMPDRIHR